MPAVSQRERFFFLFLYFFLSFLSFFNYLSFLSLSFSTLPFFFLSGAMAYSDAFFGQGTGSIYLNNVECVGNESRLSDCPNPGVNMLGMCSGHSEDAGLRCSEGLNNIYCIFGTTDLGMEGVFGLQFLMGMISIGGLRGATRSLFPPLGLLLI